MAVPAPGEKDILNRIYNRIRNETPISASLDSSIIGVILKIIAAEMSGVWDYIQELSDQSNLSTANGTALDNFGLLFAVPRKTAIQAGTSGYTRAVRFTNTGNGTASIPSGTRVFKSTDPNIAFFTIEGINLPAGNSQDIHVIAANSGEIYNVGVGELNSHSVPNVSVSVTNILPIQNGSLEESDDSYRQRILQEITLKDSVTLNNTDAMLRRVPGVKDVYILEFKRGAGTFDAVIIPYNQSDTQAIISSCQQILDSNIPVGISGIARAPQYRQLDISVFLRFLSDAGDTREQARQSIRAQIISKIDNLPVENGSGIGSFYTNSIQAIALLADPTILDAVVTLGLDGSPISSNGQITLAIGERLVLRSLSVA